MTARQTPLVVDRCRSTPTSAQARLRIGDHAATVRFDGVAPHSASVPDAFATMARILAMGTGRPVVSLHPVGSEARRRSDAFAAVALTLFPDSQHPVRLVAPPRRRAPALGDDRRVAAFFSGGVDSIALALDHHDLIDDLLYVRGFDVPLDDVARNEEVLGPVREAAAAVGKPLLVLDTDLRTFTDPHADWTWFSYGGLIATSMLLARTHRLVLCAASVADRHLPPAVVPLRAAPFGGEQVEMRLAGTAETRVEKIRTVADAAVARDTLRVCWQNVPGTLNCGTCDKCVRTMAALAALGRLGDTTAFPARLDLDVVRRQSAVTRSDRAFLLESLEVARAGGVDDLADALQAALDAGAASV